MANAMTGVCMLCKRSKLKQSEEETSRTTTNPARQRRQRHTDQERERVCSYAVLVYVGENTKPQHSSQRQQESMLLRQRTAVTRETKRKRQMNQQNPTRKA